MLSEREQKTWDEIVRNLEAEPGRAPAGTPAPIIGGVWGAVLLALFGVLPAAFAVGAVTALMWLLWRFLPRVDGASDEPVRVPDPRPAPQYHQSGGASTSRRSTGEEN